MACGDRIQQRIDLHVRTTHEEVDIIFVWYMVKLVASESIRISILSYDTDVFVLLVHSCVQKLLNYELLILWHKFRSISH